MVGVGGVCEGVGWGGWRQPIYIYISSKRHCFITNSRFTQTINDTIFSSNTQSNCRPPTLVTLTEGADRLFAGGGGKSTRLHKH